MILIDVFNTVTPITILSLNSNINDVTWRLENRNGCKCIYMNYYLFSSAVISFVFGTYKGILL